jgi:protein-S-isoprenylcysteine O-methyltransferase Ste14
MTRNRWKSSRVDDRSMRARNVPVPEPHLAGIAALLLLHALRPWTLRGRHRLAGGTSIALSAGLIAWAVAAAGQVDVERPSRLVTAGPYRFSRNPMYAGWTLLHLGIGLGRGSVWMLVTVPVASALVHREILAEEAALGDAFPTEYERYRTEVGRYLGRSR